MDKFLTIEGDEIIVGGKYMTRSKGIITIENVSAGGVGGRDRVKLYDVVVTRDDDFVKHCTYYNGWYCCTKDAAFESYDILRAIEPSMPRLSIKKALRGLAQIEKSLTYANNDR